MKHRPGRGRDEAAATQEEPPRRRKPRRAVRSAPRVQAKTQSTDIEYVVLDEPPGEELHVEQSTRLKLDVRPTRVKASVASPTSTGLATAVALLVLAVSGGGLALVFLAITYVLGLGGWPAAFTVGAPVTAWMIAAAVFMKTSATSRNR